MIEAKGCVAFPCTEIACWLMQFPKSKTGTWYCVEHAVQAIQENRARIVRIEKRWGAPLRGFKGKRE